MYFHDLVIEGDLNAYDQYLHDSSSLVLDGIKLAIEMIGVMQEDSKYLLEHRHATILVMARHVCESIDAVALLIARGCPEPCKAHLRSAFEAILGIEYILERESEQRGIAYQVAHYRRQLDFCRKVDPTEQAHAELMRVIGGDPLLGRLNLRDKEMNIKARIARYEQALLRPAFAKVNAEFDKPKSRKEWFSVYRGPTSIRDLAVHLKRGGSYEFMYRHWSNSVHAGDCLTKVRERNGRKSMKPIRHPEDLPSTVSYAVSFCVLLSRMLVNEYGSEQQKLEFGHAYGDRIRSRYMALPGQRLKIDW